MILVTGGTGFLGQWVVKRLLETTQESIRCLVRPGAAPSALGQVAAQWPDRQVELHPASLPASSATLATALEGVRTVIHIAAAKQGSAPVQVASTVVGSDALFQAAVSAGVERFILVGSLGVHDTASLRRGAVVSETTALDRHPEWRDPYTFAKHRQETLAREYAANRGLPLVVVRPGVIIGPTAEILITRVGLQMFGFLLHLGGANRLPFTYVSNCADALVLAATRPSLGTDTFNIVDDDLPTSRQIVRAYKSLVRPIRSVPVPRTALGAIARLNAWANRRSQGQIPVVFSEYDAKTIWKDLSFSNARAKSVLGWTPAVSMQSAMELTFQSLAQGRRRGDDKG
jgi:nucleoside-diphosphate-sugar epimerase